MNPGSDRYDHRYPNYHYYQDEPSLRGAPRHDDRRDRVDGRQPQDIYDHRGQAYLAHVDDPPHLPPHDRAMTTIDTTIVIRVKISDTTLDIEVTLLDETISIGELPVSRQIAMLIIASIRVHKTTLAHPRTHVTIVITIRSVIPIIGVTRVLPTTTLVMTNAPADTTIGIGDMRIIVPAY